MKTLAALLFLQTLATLASGQALTGRITGSLQDSSGAPIDAVSVSLVREKDSSTTKMAVTDKSGQFIFQNITFGKYIVTATHVGYMTWRSQVLELSQAHRVIPVGNIAMRRSDGNLGQITVLGSRPPIENRIDKTVVNVEASSTNSGLTALEVLEKSPGVMVDNDGNISLNGKPNVLVMIDGKPTYLSAQDLSGYLKNMPANQLDQIEIMSQPPAKYDASGNSGVINLITKKNKNSGFNGSVTLTAIIAKYFKSPNNAIFNWRTGKFNIYGNYGYTWWEGFNDIHGSNDLRAGEGIPFDRYTEQHTYGRYADQNQTYRAGIDYFANKRTTFGLSVNGTIDKQSFSSSSTTDFYDSLHNFVQYNVAQSQNSTPETHMGFNGNFQRKLDDKGGAFSVDADYVFYNYHGTVYSNNYLYNADHTPSEPPYLLNGLLPSNIDIYSIKADYHKNLNKDIVLEAGIKSSYVKTDNNAIYTLYDNNSKAWEPDSAISNHFIYKENINAAYVNWQQNVKKFTFQVGLRAEQTNNSGQQTVQNQDFKHNYIQFFPTTFLTYKKNDNNTFEVSYGRRIERPEYQDLNPFRFQLDRYTYEQGNPNLQPQLSDNIELKYNYKGRLNFTANYTLTNDVISPTVITFKQPGDSNYTTYETTQNLASQTNIGLSINYTGQFSKAWTLNAFLNVYVNKYRGIVDSTNIDVNYPSFNASFNTQYHLKKGWVTELSGFYYGRNYISGAVLADGRGMFSFGASKQIWNGKASFKLNVRDPFYLMSFTAHTDLSKAVTYTHYVWDNRRLIFTFVYRFGKTPGNNQPQHRNSGASDEQSRVGGGNTQQ